MCSLEQQHQSPVRHVHIDGLVERVRCCSHRRELCNQQALSSNGATGLNKYYQIYNPTGAAINLADDYSIAACANGCSSAGAFEYGYRFAKGATIAAGGTYTICNDGLEDTTGCDELLKYPRVSYTGNDLLALIYGTDHVRATTYDVVDRIGLFSTDRRVPSWTVCGEASRVVAADVLLTRATDTCCGSGMSDGAFALNWPDGAVCDWTDRKNGGYVRAWGRAGAPCGAALTRPPSPPAPPPTTTILGVSVISLFLDLAIGPNPPSYFSMKRIPR